MGHVAPLALPHSCGFQPAGGLRRGRRSARPRADCARPRARGRVAVALDRRVQVFMLAILTLCLPSVSKAVFQSLLGSFVHPFMHRRACMCTLGRSFPTPPHRNPCSRRFPGPTPPHRNPCSRSLLGSPGGLAGLKTSNLVRDFSGSAVAVQLQCSCSLIAL